MAERLITGQPGAYASAEPLPVDVLDVDGDAAAAIRRSLHIASQTLKALALEQELVHWPEHLDSHHREGAPS